MGDMGDYFRDARQHRRDQRREHGVDCPECRRLQPKRNATILLPGQRCRVDGYVDRRPKLLPIDQSGERNPQAKYTERQIEAFRRSYAELPRGPAGKVSNGELKRLAIASGIEYHAARSISRGETWAISQTDQ